MYLGYSALTDASDSILHSYVQIAAIMLFYYDYLLTFAAEVSHVWPQPISVNTFLFFLNRYFSVCGNIVAAFLLFADLGNSNQRSVLLSTLAISRQCRTKVFSIYSCDIIVHAREALLVLGQIVVSATLATRTMALYHSSRTVVIGVLGIGIVIVGVTCWTLVAGGGSTFVPTSAPGCHYILSERSAIHLAAAWEASALFDVLVFSLTLMRTFKMRKMHNMAISLTGEGLMDMVLRDGALYFAVMALANLANIFAFYFAVPTFKGAFSTPASCISSLLCSRLVLNLYEVATPDNTGSGSSPELMTTVILTTRIELGTFKDDDLSEVESTGSSAYQ
ncbi:hypothetical protein DFH94DRAFT_830774 [Russula ochroleuca]|uniref:DUF6533 domain-containing protein n=1 Tax=Russula ochroleuca TaxID=152965 RepID=A0A9P5MW42_9AGAM|nr:hypothetical protein DFH94DRAFT_830774 [Russula ochroleuca]